MDVTVIILTKNEELNIENCIRSIDGFAQRIVIVDSGSTDRTCEIAANLGADIYVHHFENYSKQFNWALDHVDIQTKWTFRLDADEYLTPDLCMELEELTIEHDQDDVNGITMEAWLVFLGRTLKHGCPNKRKLMLFKTGLARIEDRKMDEHTILSKGTSVSCKNRFIHHDFKSIDHWIKKLNWYATREMQDYIDFMNTQKSDCDLMQDSRIENTRKKKFGFYYRLPSFIRCIALFIYNYIFRLGFLDGKEGFIYNYMYHMWYRSLVDAKILEQKKFNAPLEETGDLK